MPKKQFQGGQKFDLFFHSECTKEGPDGQNQFDDKVTLQCDFCMGPSVKHISYI